LASYSFLCDAIIEFHGLLFRICRGAHIIDLNFFRDSRAGNQKKIVSSRGFGRNYSWNGVLFRASPKVTGMMGKRTKSKRTIQFGILTSFRRENIYEDS